MEDLKKEAEDPHVYTVCTMSTDLSFQGVACLEGACRGEACHAPSCEGACLEGASLEEACGLQGEKEEKVTWGGEEGGGQYLVGGLVSGGGCMSGGQQLQEEIGREGE